MGSESESERQKALQRMRELDRYFSVKADTYIAFYKIGWTMQRTEKWSFVVFFLIALGIPFAQIGKGFVPTATMERTIDRICIIAGIAIVVWLILVKTVLKKNADRKRQVLWDELCDYHSDFGECELGVENCSPYRLRAIYSKLESGQASTIKEALNMLHDDAQKAKLRDEIRNSKVNIYYYK